MSVRSEDILNDDQSYANFQGRNIRKGTIAAFISNIKLIESLDHSTDNSKREQIIKDIVDSKEDLKALGIFDVFIIKNQEIALLLKDIE